jgi:antitoxin component YwqK of YwqJK toxin-antitoxin module
LKTTENAQPFTLLDQDGAVQMQGQLAAGKLEGELRIHQDGVPHASMRFAGGVQQGECVLLHALHRPSARLFYVDGRLDGPAEFYSLQGVVVRRTHYRRGLVHGLQQDFYPDGTLFEEAMYVRGLPDGPWRRFHPGGALSERRTYVAGVVIGAPERFDERGLVLKG